MYIFHRAARTSARPDDANLWEEISFVRCNPVTLDKWKEGCDIRSVLKPSVNHSPKNSCGEAEIIWDRLLES